MDAKSLVRFGRVFDLELLTRSRSMVTELQADESHRGILCVAVDRGVHSILEVLLRVAGWKPNALNRALWMALHQKRADLARILLDAAASLLEVDLVTICGSLDLALVRRALREGVDPSDSNGFADALCCYRAKPMLRIYLDLRSEFPVLDSQAAISLCEAVQKKDVRWTALLLWAGANPRQRAPYNLVAHEAGDNDMWTTALEKACWDESGNMIRLLKISPSKIEALELLDKASDWPAPGVIEYLLPFIPAADLNLNLRNLVGLNRTRIRATHRETLHSSYHISRSRSRAVSHLLFVQ